MPVASSIPYPCPASPSGYKYQWTRPNCFSERALAAPLLHGLRVVEQVHRPVVEHLIQLELIPEVRVKLKRRSDETALAESDDAFTRRLRVPENDSERVCT